MYNQVLDLPNYTSLADDERSENTKNRNTEDIGHKDNKIYTRYVLNTRDNISNQAEDDLTLSSAPKYIS